MLVPVPRKVIFILLHPFEFLAFTLLLPLQQEYTYLYKVDFRLQLYAEALHD